ncbi:MAG: SAM-dependent methyltransferase [Gammaproteobacteria bacterium]|nr:SAM-dependent methyltransferase [Nitrococcus sp.]MDN5864434.1 SAM-dependent methyltransferase [Gammaproteobacteria bacterium]
MELVDSVTRLCAMNMLLHGIGDESDEQLPVVTADALAGKHGEYDVVLANPPFGKKSSVTIVNDAGETTKESLTIHRDDFWSSTSNKQLNFVQHIFTILKQGGRAALWAGFITRLDSRLRGNDEEAFVQRCLDSVAVGSPVVFVWLVVAEREYDAVGVGTLDDAGAAGAVGMAAWAGHVEPAPPLGGARRASRAIGAAILAAQQFAVRPAVGMLVEVGHLFAPVKDTGRCPFAGSGWTARSWLQ